MTPLPAKCKRPPSRLRPAAAKHIDSKTAQALSQLDKATDSVKRELSELERKHTPKLGNVAETMMEIEVRAFLRSLPEHQLAGKLGEAAIVGDIVTLRAALFGRGPRPAKPAIRRLGIKRRSRAPCARRPVFSQHSFTQLE